MHRELYGIDDLLHVAEGIDLFFKYRRFWTVGKMRQPAASAILILGLIRDLTKVCRADDWIFQDRAHFLANKIDLLLRRHQLQGPRGTIRLRYKRYQCAPVRTQDLMVQLQTPHTQHNTPSGHTGEHGPGGPGHRTRNTTHRVGTPVNRSQVAQDAARAKQRTERAHR